MQQLTAQQLRQAIAIEGDVISLKLPLPDSVAVTHQWLRQFCALSQTSVQDQVWGADRYQVHLYLGSLRLLLCIEWLCEAIWLEPDAGETQSLEVIADELQRNLGSQNLQ